MGTDTRIPDVRKLPAGEFEEIVRRAETELGTDLDTSPSRVVRKARTIGAPTLRGTWARIQLWALDDPALDSEPGVRAADRLSREVPRPAWHGGAQWSTGELVWRVDEMDYVTDPPVIAAGTLTSDPGFGEQWWRALSAALKAMWSSSPSRMPRTVVNQQRFTDRIHRAFGTQIDAQVTQWAPVHADLAWANLCGPQLMILDWEELGTGPAGLAHARLWADSLAAPEVAEQCETWFARFLQSRQGLLCRAYAVAPLLNYPASEPLHEAAVPVAQKIAAELGRL